jgi:hypothetical protein
VDIENRHHLIWACKQARDFVIAENDWRRSIESQGVMEAVWLVATTYQHADGSPPATALVSVEGSSRETAVHSILDIHTADVPYDDADAKLRAHVRRLNDSYDRGEGGTETAVALRCERIPALILIGFSSGHTQRVRRVFRLPSSRSLRCATLIRRRLGVMGRRMSRLPTKFLMNFIGET